MENLIKEKVLRIFDLEKIHPGDVIQFYKFGDGIRTATENALVIETKEDIIIAIKYKSGLHQDYETISFEPNDKGIQITNVIRAEN